MSTKRNLYISISIIIIVMLFTYLVYPKKHEVQYETKYREQQPTMDKFIGINSFIDDPKELIKVGGVVREYHNWQWNDRPIYIKGKPHTHKYPDNKLVFNLWSGAWNFDGFYEKLNNEGIEVVPCIMGSLKAVNNNYGIPVAQGKSTTDPFSFYEHADFMYQYAARYGSKTIAKERLKGRHDIDQPDTSGMNLVHYIENWNEPNAWWLGEQWEFSPEEFAAMSSADYDGHLGQMGDSVGVKNADPNMKMVMGGLISLDLDYVKKMKEWSDKHRNGKVPFDVINLHHYSFKKPFGDDSRYGVSPEEDDFKEKVLEFIQYRDQNLPGVELWVTEFGYDTSPQSPQSAKEIGDFSIEQVQGIWLVRSYLELAAAGVDRAMMYMLRDAGGKGRYGSSGLVGPKNDWTKKVSWYNVYTLKNALNNMRFYQALESGNNNVNIYEFRNPDNGESAYVVWCTTSKDLKVKGFELNIPGVKKGTASVISLQDDSIDGQKTSLPVKKGVVTLDVSESPVFVKFSK